MKYSRTVPHYSHCPLVPNRHGVLIGQMAVYLSGILLHAHSSPMKKKERNRILLRPEAETVCEEFGLMQEELKKICFAGFSEEERKEGEKLLRRLNDNMIRFMVKEEPVREGREE